MSISTVIRSIQDIMRKDAGIDGDAQRIGQLAWMLFLRVFDSREAELELLDDDYVSPIPSEFRWRNWAADPEGETGDTLLAFVNDELFPALKELAAQSGGRSKPGQVVQAAFEDAYQYMKSGTLLRQVINKLNKIDFDNLANRHVFNDIYEQILKDLQSAGNAGEFYTPRPVTRFMVETLDPKLGDIILDPACGTGGFLTCAIEHVRKSYVHSPEDENILCESIRGVEKKALPHLLCTTNLLLRGVDVPSNIRHDNALTRPLRDYGADDKVDVIVTNPPFGGTEETGIEANFPRAYRTRETADLFLLLIRKILKPRGRAAVILPDGNLSTVGVQSKIKEFLMSQCRIHSIVRMPAGVFNPYTPIKTNILFLEAGTPTDGIWFFELQVDEGRKQFTKTRPITDKSFSECRKWIRNPHESDSSWFVTNDQIVAADFTLDFRNPTSEEEVIVDVGQLLDRLREDMEVVVEASSELQKIASDWQQNA